MLDNKPEDKKIFHDIISHKEKKFAVPYPPKSPFYKNSQNVIGSLLSKVIYPAHKPNNTKENTFFMKHHETFFSEKERKSQLSEKDLSQGWHMLLFGGNCAKSSSIFPEDSLEELAEQGGINIHCIEMPGIEESKGNLKSSSNCVRAAIAQVEYLIYRGANPEKIILYGHSLGGAIATIAAAHLHHQGKKVSLYNDRSFSSIGSLVEGQIIKKIALADLIMSCAMYILGFITIKTALYSLLAIYPFIQLIKVLVRVTGWEMNAGDAYLSLPKYYKTLAYVNNDNIVINNGGLHRLEKEIDRKKCFYNPNNRNNSEHCDLVDDLIINDDNSEMNKKISEKHIMLSKRYTIYQDIIFFIKQIKFRHQIELSILQDQKNNVPNFKEISYRLVEEYKKSMNKKIFFHYISAICKKIFISIKSLFFRLKENEKQKNYLINTEKLTEKIITIATKLAMDHSFMDESEIDKIISYGRKENNLEKTYQEEKKLFSEMVKKISAEVENIK